MKIRALLLLTASAVFWGLNFHLAKVMLARVSFVEAGFWRYVLGVAVLWLINRRFRDRGRLNQLKQNRKGLLWVGVVGLFGFNILFFLGLQFTSALNAALIVSLNPAFTVLLESWLNKRPIRSQLKFGILLALMGVFFLLTKGQFLQILDIEWAWGDLLILGANLVFAMHHIWVKRYGAALSQASFTFWTNAICLVCFLLVLPFVGVHAPAKGDLPFWLAAVGMGIPGTALAYLFWNRGIAKTGAATAGLVMNVVPLAAAILAVFFGEQLEMYHLWSGLLIVGGMLVSTNR